MITVFMHETEYHGNKIQYLKDSFDRIKIFVNDKKAKSIGRKRFSTQLNNGKNITFQIKQNLINQKVYFYFDNHGEKIKLELLPAQKSFLHLILTPKQIKHYQAIYQNKRKKLDRDLNFYSIIMFLLILLITISPLITAFLDIAVNILFASLILFYSIIIFVFCYCNSKIIKLKALQNLIDYSPEEKSLLKRREEERKERKKKKEEEKKNKFINKYRTIYQNKRIKLDRDQKILSNMMFLLPFFCLIVIILIQKLYFDCIFLSISIPLLFFLSLYYCDAQATKLEALKSFVDYSPAEKSLLKKRAEEKPSAQMQRSKFLENFFGFIIVAVIIIAIISISIMLFSWLVGAVGLGFAIIIIILLFK